MYKNLLFIGLMLLLPAFVFPPETRKWLISENSSLSVNGSTNINTFACEIPTYDQTDTIILTKGNRDITLSGKIGLSIQSFDCHNTIMTHDLRSTLKEKQFPRLYITFLSLSELPELTAKAKPITGLVNIDLAGTSKQFLVNYLVSVDGQKVIHLLGVRDVNFSDFNLIPPRKLGGMIRTKDQLSVSFHLKMKALE